MSEVYIDYKLLTEGSINIDKLYQANDKQALTSCEDCDAKLKELSSKHDNCFSSITCDELSSKITDVNNNLKEITVTAEEVVDVYSKAELGISNEVHNINSKGLKYAIYKQFQENPEIYAGYNYQTKQELLDAYVESKKGTRAKVTASAFFLATNFYHLPYFWGGGHDHIANGLDPEWGSQKTVTAADSKTTGHSLPYSVDCSGYVSWALKNGGYNINAPLEVSGLKAQGSSSTLKGIDINEVQNGDLGYLARGNEEHIGIIVNKEGNELTFAHCSGSGNGMNLTTIDTSTGLVSSDATNPERVGTEYFTEVVKMNYDS